MISRNRIIQLLATPSSSSGLERVARAAAIGVAVATTAVGCAPAGEGEDENAAATSAPLKAESWRTFGTLTTATFPIADEPIAFATVPLISTVAARNSSDKKYYLQTVITYHNSAWAVFDGKAFASPPAATHFSTYNDSGSVPNPYYFVIAGKHTSTTSSPDSTKLFAMVGTADRGTDALNPQPPTAGTWVQLGTETYPNPGEGYPALSTSGFRIVLAVRALDSSPGVNQQRIFTFHRSTASTGTWSSRVSAPLFPSGVVPVGTPAIAFLKNPTNTAYTNRFVIMTRTQSGGIAWILYNPTASTPWGTWTEAFVPYPLTSDPSVEWDPTNQIMTLYYKSANWDGSGSIEVTNTSVPDPGSIGVYPFYYIDETGSSTLLGSPRASMGGGKETNRRVVVFRGSTSSTQPGDLDRTIVYAQDIPTLYPPLW